MALWGWSTTAGNNANVGSINWAEGMPPSAVNNSARQMMADVADYVNNPGPEWYQHDSAAYASGTTFTVAGDQTGYYLAGRRLRAVNSSTTIYGAVVSATFSTNTTITAVWDSGSLDAGLSSLKVGQIPPTNTSFPKMASIGLLASNLSAKTLFVDTSSNFKINSSAGSAIMTLTDAGAVTFAGDVGGTSDERFKDDWQAMPEDFVERLALVLSGSFLRTDEIEGPRHVGVGAQSFRKVMPDAVKEDADGRLSVVYGQAALVACVELAKEVRRLRAVLKEHGIKS